jgi:hypothetical protein
VPHRHDSAAWLEALVTHLDPAATTALEVGAGVSTYFSEGLSVRGLTANVLAEDGVTEGLLRRLTASGRRPLEVLPPSDPRARGLDTTDVVLLHAGATVDPTHAAGPLARLEAVARAARRQVFVLADRSAPAVPAGGAARAIDAARDVMVSLGFSDVTLVECAAEGSGRLLVGTRP